MSYADDEKKVPVSASGDSASLLKPGVSIRPVINSGECRGLIKRLYGLEPVDLRELNGYDDKNYLVEVRSRGTGTNGHGDGFNQPVEEYVLKIMNSLDSMDEGFVEGQNALLIYLGDQGTLCPRPVLNVLKKYYSVEELASGSHIVRLMRFVPGTILNDIPRPIPRDVFRDAGRYIARIDKKIKDFHHPAYDTHKTLWTLDSIPELKKFTFAITDPKRKRLIEATIEHFENLVLANRDKFTPGLIHGDFNEQNVIVERDDSGWRIKGVLDFGDSHYSCYLYELAITMTYMMIVGKDIGVGGLVIEGYRSVQEISEFEYSLLKICVMARLCQSLVLGAYSIQQDPGNAYLLTTAAPGWDLLEKLNTLPEKEVYDAWKQINL